LEKFWFAAMSANKLCINHGRYGSKSVGKATRMLFCRYEKKKKGLRFAAGIYLFTYKYFHAEIR
jgi:predicted DNA-binding WGR domain protein